MNVDHLVMKARAMGATLIFMNDGGLRMEWPGDVRDALRSEMR